MYCIKLLTSSFRDRCLLDLDFGCQLGEGHHDESGVGAAVPVRDPSAGQGAPRRDRGIIALFSYSICSPLPPLGSSFPLLYTNYEACFMKVLCFVQLLPNPFVVPYSHCRKYFPDYRPV
jgi:hypothetical protein